MTWDSELHWQGDPRLASILVIMDAPSQQTQAGGMVASPDQQIMFGEACTAQGFKRSDFFFVTPSPPIPEEDRNSERRKADFIAPFRASILSAIDRVQPRCVVAMGGIACRQMFGKPTKIGRVRGIPQVIRGQIVLVTYALGFCQRFPENLETLMTDIRTLARLRDAGYNLDEADRLNVAQTYEWREDISDILDNPPDIMAVDTEGTGLVWADPDVSVMTVQLSWAPGRAVACPIYAPYWRSYRHRMGDLRRLKGQLAQLLGNPAIRKVAHNLNFDAHMLREAGLPVAGWLDDTMVMAAGVDENMVNKGLDECVRRWVPEMAGYADQFNREFDKSKMIDVPPEKLLPYACGDADSTLRLHGVLTRMMDEDTRAANAYRRCTMPALLAFGDPVERTGLMIDVDELAGLQVTLTTETANKYRDLISAVPTVVKERHADKGLEFSRPDFVRDILFSSDGMNLTPTLFTKSTTDLPPEQRVPSISGKQHLAQFAQDNPFVALLIEYQKLQKMRGTYVGHPANDEGPATGFYQHLITGPTGTHIYPSYHLHRARTGRSASSNPNGQNIPARGPLAIQYRRIFIPTPGFGFIECDLSQIELRIAAWMAWETVMMGIFQEGGDIHSATAQVVLGLSDLQWAALSDQERKDHRQAAKAVNFGLIYGMQWRGLQAYAKTDYGVDLSDRQAQLFRERYFAKYPALAQWHEDVKAFVHEHQYVRAPHGPVRHLPSIRSPEYGVVGEAERQAINSPVQRTGSDLGLLAMIRLTRDADPDQIRAVGFIHDSLIAEARLDIMDQAASHIRWYMETPPLVKWFGEKASCPVPIVADVKISTHSLSAMVEVDVPAIRPSWARDD